MTIPPDTAERLEGVLAMRHELHGASSVADLLGRAADVVAPACGFERGVAVTVVADQLTTTNTSAVRSPEGDRMRRQLLAEPVPLLAGNEEHEIVRRGSSMGRAGRVPQPSALAAALGLEHFVLAAIAPEARTLALLVVDRAAEPVTRTDVALVETVAAFVAIELAQVVQRTRVAELAAEVRQFSIASLALARESCQAPVVLPHDRGVGLAFPTAEQVTPATASAHELFSDRELRVAALLAQGRSNREIAMELTISPETVKSHVGRILRKLGASNRAEAVSRYLRLESAATSDV